MHVSLLCGTLGRNLLLMALFGWAFGCQSEYQKDGAAYSAAVVGPYKGKPTIFLNGTPVAPVQYGLTDVPGGRWSWEEIPQHNIRQFCEQGIRLYQLDLFLEQFWQADGSLDLSLAKKQVDGVLEVCPDAGVVFRFHLNAPKWWMELHPEEMTRYDGVEPMPDEQLGFSRLVEADARIPIRASFASKRWQSEAREKLAAFCQSFSKTPQGDRLIGMHLANGVYGEWHQWGFMRNEADFSSAMEAHFREWLQKKYGSQTALQRAWADSTASFASASIPDTEERSHTSAGIFRDPQAERNVIDYYSCQHELVADLIIDFCSTVKENWPRPILTGAFYGYYFSVFGREAAGGHLALQKVLASDQIDYLSGPQSYYPDSGYHPGEPYRSRTLNHSLLLNGKLWLDEYDQQPRRVWPYQGLTENREAYEQALTANVSMIRRNVLYPLLKGQGLWFYDFGPASMHLHPNNQRNDQAGTNGYWDHPRYMETIGALKAIADTLLHQEYESGAEVLAVFDTESIKYTRSTRQQPCPITPQLINYSSLALFYSGALFDAIHLADLDKADLSSYKAVVFFNTFVMDAGSRALIKNKVAAEGRHLVWMYAPGYLDGNDFQSRFVSELTGINLKTTHYGEALKIIFGDTWTTLDPMEATAAYDPVFYPEDPEMTQLGTYQGLNLPAIGRKEQATHTAWYSGVPIVNPEVFRQIWKKAGVSIYTDNGDIAYGNRDWIMIHSKTAGTKVLPGGKEIETKNAPSTLLLERKSNRLLLE